MSLATIYRPRVFDEVVGQSTAIKVLKRQCELNTFAHCYLFVGSSGCGKTSTAYILARTINGGIGEPIEIDAASNGGVDAIRNIVADASTRSLDGSEYKIFIIDEVQSITSAGWQAFLKCIEEVTKYTIFIFCTTEEQKVPETIKNRCMRFYFSKIPTKEIIKRLDEVCLKANINCSAEAKAYIAMLAKGCMREAISLLEKVASTNTTITIQDAIETLGDFSYNAMFNLTNAIIDKNKGYILKMIDDIYNNGKDLKLFIDQYLGFVLDLNKYALYHDISLTDIPASLEIVDNDSHCVRYITDYVTADWLSKLSESILDLKAILRNDTFYKSTIEVHLTKLCN